MSAFDFHIGAQVHCTDGPCGKLVKIVVDPKTQQVTELIVEKGFLLKTDRVIPVSAVASATEQDVHLNVDSDDVAGFTEYREVTVKEPAPDAGGYRTMANSGSAFGAYSEPHVPMIRKRLREGITAGKAVIDRKSGVENLDKTLGHVDHVIVDGETGKISHLVMRSGLFAEYHLLPIEVVEEVGDDIFVLLSREELAALPRYEPGAGVDLQSEEQLLNTLETEPLTLAPDEQMPDVTTRVLTALSADPRTQRAVIEVICDRGVITLQGEVDSFKTRSAAEEIAAREAGVTRVHNELIAPRVFTA